MSTLKTTYYKNGKAIKTEVTEYIPKDVYLLNTRNQAQAVQDRKDHYRRERKREHNYSISERKVGLIL